MSGMHLRRTVTFAAVLAGLLCWRPVCGFAQQQDPSQKPTGDAVADAARKARDDKKKEAKPKKVFTNEDLGGLPANAVSTLGSAPASSETPAEGADNQAAKAKEPGKEGRAAADADKDPEKIWRKRFKEAYAKLAQLEKELDILQREQGKAELQYYPDPQKAMQEGYSRKDINEHDAQIAAKKQEIDQQKQRISDMEDELRKAGGDPGWASQ